MCSSTNITQQHKTQVQEAIYASFVRFMAQRPEFPGDPKLLIRINEGNAEMCTGWLRESKSDKDVDVRSVINCGYHAHTAIKSLEENRE